MEFIYGKMSESEMDLSIIDAILREEKVKALFFKESGFSGEIVKIYRSLLGQQSDGTIGESDIVLLIKNNSGKVNAIFIEDKINAEVMPEQRKRYDDRAKIMKADMFENYVVILCAPQKYLDTSRKDGYEHTISYEQILENISDEFLKSRFKYSITEKHLGYVPNKCEPITLFWNNLYKYIDEHYKNSIRINKTTGGRGKNACWPIFKTNIKGLRIIWKSDRDVIDLEFAGMGKRMNEIVDILKRINSTKYEVVNTKKSCSLRINVEQKHHVNFSGDFNEQIKSVQFVLNSVLYFYKVSKNIQYLSIQSFPVNSVFVVNDID